MGNDKKRKAPPEYLLVPRSHRHRHMVAIVKSKDEYGRPVLVEIQHELNDDREKTIDIVENPELITLYTPEANTRKIR